MQNSNGKGKSFLVALIILFLALGVFDSYKLFKIDIELWGGQREVPSFCNVTEFINCDAVSMSDYSMLLGISNSTFGIVAYGLFLIVVLLAFLSSVRIYKHLMRLTFIFYFCGVLLSIYLAYVSIVVVKALCILCFGSYLINFGLLIFSYLILRENPFLIVENFFKETILFLKKLFTGDKRERFTSIKIEMVFALLILLGIFGVKSLNYYFKLSTKTMPVDEKRLVGDYLNIPKIDFQVFETSSPWGTRGARVKIIEFSDFKCPFCRFGDFMVKNLIQQYKDSVELIFKNYPLDASCNKNVGSTLHPMSCLMSKAALCADKSGKFWEFHDFLFKNARDISRYALLDYAKKEGIDSQNFEKCLDSEEIQNMVERELDDAKKFNISVTPTFIINGRVLKGLLPPELFQKGLSHPKLFQVILKHELGK